MFKRSLPLFILTGLFVLTSCAGVGSGSTGEISVATDKLTFIDFYSDECPNCMVMIPIVQALEARYHDHMTFKLLNIDTDGKSLFESLGLRSNPVFLILKPDSTVVYKGFGKVPELALDKAIRTAIGL